MIYLDNSATTQLCWEAKENIISNMENFGNPSSLYDLGVKAAVNFRNDLGTMLSALGGEGTEMIITSGGTESDNLAVLGAAHARKKRGKRIITSSVEHPAIMNTMEALKEEGFEIIYVDPEDGRISPQSVLRHVNDDTILISMMKVNNETGAIFPVESISRGAKRINGDVLVHCDFVQGFMKCDLDLKDLDLVSISGHKIHAPKGVGGLYIRKGVRILPEIFGGGQQGNIRPGTENTLLASAFAAAVRAAKAQGHGEVQKCRSRLMDFIKNTDGIECNSPDDGLAYIVNMSVMGIRSETMLHFLEEKGIYVSSGSACSKGKKSRVLGAFGIDDSRVDSALRISFSRYTKVQEIEEFTQAVAQGMSTLQRKRR